NQWSAANLTRFNGMLIGMSPTPKPQLVVAGVRGGVYVTGSGESYMETIASHHERGHARGAILKLKTIGAHLYACGNARTVGTRKGKEDWYTHSVAITPEREGESGGFDDIDGFSEGDLYAAGGDGDVWHFDGERWQKCTIPTELWINTVCCGGDGNVYLGGLHGHVFKGRGNQWRQIHQGAMTIPFRDMVWYEGVVWCASDYGIWTIANDQLIEADVPSAVKICAGNLSARDGILLVAGHGGAAFREDGKWKVIFHSGDMSAAATLNPD
ncbi:MAG: hypothetical protein LH481_00005, partial [Burkholderiales bacterium]|nr:hypothetical protein [Burkholderiales bacterium]